MNMIVAADANWGIGSKGALLMSIPADLKMFRQETLGKVIVYGRKTLETFPMRQPLDRRENIILSSRPDYRVKGASVVHSVEELLDVLKAYDSKDVYIIGGASVYRELLPYADTCHVTRIDQAFEADCYFPDLDADPEWEVTGRSDEMSYFDTTYHFVRYERKK
ncbi:dihydrofolate reductase [Lachnoclostridium sp. Marseille-P6806]|uniref:dihydrofolate reductase n=1 Tax=Lachnoclostridium sp. Marseille-P6806 TaxID=2364793 RepID=UPI001030179B|nr:dihydrofolate reductase [Lachnoclostridium sp. Marseille-P6806]